MEGEPCDTAHTALREEARRERSNSTSIMECLQWTNKDNEIKIAKRKRCEREAEDIFKRCNRVNRTPPEVKRLEDEGKKSEEKEKREEESALVAILREIKEEMVDLRKEMSEVKAKMHRLEEKWETREKRLEGRLDKMEKGVEDLERQRNGGIGENGNLAEEVAERAIDPLRNKDGGTELQGEKIMEETMKEVRKLKRTLEEKERKEKKNNIVIRGLNKGEGSIKDAAGEFLNKEFDVKEKVKMYRL